MYILRTLKLMAVTTGRMYKTDKTGVPVYYERIGAVDVKCVFLFLLLCISALQPQQLTLSASFVSPPLVFNNHHHRRANRGLVSSVPAEDITSFHIHQQEEARALYPPPCLGHAAMRPSSTAMAC